MFDKKIVLITGGTGTFGSAFVKKLMDSDVNVTIRVFSRGEDLQHQMASRFPHNDPRLRFLIGDVRDRERLIRAMQNVDYVVHAAAMKQVPTCEYNPTEAVDTNIGGARNVIDAAIVAGVKKAIAISTDKACIDYHARVQMENGKTVPINLLVKERMQSRVLSLLNDGSVGSRRVTNWYKNNLNNRPMIRINRKNGYDHIGQKNRLLLTDDHPVLTPTGWRAAGILRTGDLIMTTDPNPNYSQMAFLCGKVMGDAHIMNNGRSPIKISQSVQEWVEICHRTMVEFNPNPIRLQHNNRGRADTFTFTIPAQSFTRDLRDDFYDNGVKIVPKKTIEKYFSPEFMAAWYLDDGCLADKKYARIATHGFTESENVWLMDLLNKNDIGAYTQLCKYHDKEYWEIRLTATGSIKFFNIIGRFVPPSMRYKVPNYAPQYEQQAWSFGHATRFIDEIIVSNENSYRSKDVYCIDVDDSHNFSVNGIILHNCSPVNLYGATKLVMERLFTQANTMDPTGTRFSCVRYGNVIGSRGSVIPVWQRQVDAHEDITITNEHMTRFLLTKQFAVDFVNASLDIMQGGEIFVPRIPTATIKIIRDAIFPGHSYMITGVRPGEKMHEILITRDEARHTRDLGYCYAIYPEFPFWTELSPGEIGTPIGPSFEYVSSGTEHMVAGSKIKELLSEETNDN